MQYYAELHPRRIDEQFLRSLDQYDGFNIPDSPLGNPSPNPLALGCLVRRVYADKRIIINQRLLDVNELHLLSIAQGALMLKLDIALTRGDVPRIGRSVGYLSSEEALRLIKSNVKGISVGLMISMRYPKEDIVRRMQSGADFYLALRVSKPSDLGGLDTGKIIPYVLILTNKNKGILSKINQPYVSEESLREFLTGLRDVGIKGVLLSTPGDHEALIRLSRYFI